MTFHLAETWEPDDPSPLPRLPSKGLQTMAAFLLTLGIETLLLMALWRAGLLAPATSPLHAGAITTIDIASASTASEGASRAQHSEANTPPTPTRIDATIAPPLPREWSVVPLAKQPLVTTPDQPATAAPDVRGQSQGAGAAGIGGGAGYDPYAFASYLPSAPAAGAPSGKAMRVGALAELAGLLRAKSGVRGLRLALRLTVSSDGRIARGEVVSGPFPLSASALDDMVRGFQLYPVNAPPGPADIEVTLSL